MVNQGAAMPIMLSAASLGEAWARLVTHIVDNTGNRIAPLTLSIGNQTPANMFDEDDNSRTALDQVLAEREALSVNTVAFTIFPQRYADISGDRFEFFDLYRRSFPRIQARNRRLNNRGLYFERLVMYGEGKCDGNQLEWFITQHQRVGVRASMFQAAIFDPKRDHSNTAQLNFPCLHSISFVPDGTELVLNAFYPTQQILRKSYGNYLGLLQLGRFMANEMKLNFVRLNVFVGIAKLDEIAKTGEEFRPVVTAARECLNRLEL